MADSLEFLDGLGRDRGRKLSNFGAAVHAIESLPWRRR
jgi:hypothetical protein